MDYRDYYWGFYRDYYRDPFHSLLSTREVFEGVWPCRAQGFWRKGCRYKAHRASNSGR